MADNETTADIIAEMRRGTRLPGYWSSCAVNEILQYHADRLEAAQKREAAFHAMTCEANDRLREHLQIALDANRRERGDAAKLREALEEVLNDYQDDCAMSRMIRAALAAPPRNCDRFASAEEAIEYHKRTNCAERRYCAYHDGCPTDGSCVVNWLYAEAQEGGAK